MIDFQPVREIKVGLDFGDDVISVGRLAIRDGRIYFEYDASFIDVGIELSPLRLPLKRGVSSFDPFLFEGLPGLFNDSLPDGWGRLLFDRFARSHGVLPQEISPLDRLAYMGRRALGALVYEPDHAVGEQEGTISLDALADQAQEILEGRAEDVLEDLLALNGSSAGARPKALLGVDRDRRVIIHGVSDLPDGFDHWLIKFPNSQDGIDAGAVEYVYALMAKDAGIEMPDVHLFPAASGPGYFGIRRFDRVGDQRFHMHTACGLVHSDFRTPSMDYEDLVALTQMLTRDIREVEKLYRLAVFNVLAHNRDDHSKNFSFLMARDGNWRLSPAYDLTFSSGPRGEQSTMVMGEGRNPGIEHLRKLGKEASLPKGRADEIIADVKAALLKWQSLAKEFGVSPETLQVISRRLLMEP
nr:type II toxin-antitoxin system HipA family toxin [uncultured Cohaesibacter sp.]